MAAQRLTDRLTRLGIPQPQRIVRTAADDARAIGADRHTPDPAFMAAQRLTDRLTGLYIPQPQRVVVTAADDARAIGAERHTGDHALMAAQRQTAELLPAKHRNGRVFRFLGGSHFQ